VTCPRPAFFADLVTPLFEILCARHQRYSHGSLVGASSLGLVKSHGDEELASLLGQDRRASNRNAAGEHAADRPDRGIGDDSVSRADRSRPLSRMGGA
jgi:hypothetical protein